MWLSFHFLALVAYLQLVFAQQQSPSIVGPAWTVSPFHPHAIPLAVRSPFFSSWAAGGNGSAPICSQWPNLSDMKSILGWAIYVKVDAVAYRILGAAPLTDGAQVANQTSFSFTATRSNFVHTAGPMTVSTSFISPVEPSNLVLQSFPGAYISINVQSNDGNRHGVQVYSDISAEWISGDDGLTAVWDTTVSSSSVIHNVNLQNPQPFTVINNHVHDATAYYGIAAGDRVTWRTGADVVTRSQFISQGKLLNTKDTNFRAVSNAFPVMGLSMDLGTIATPDAPVVFALALIRDPAIRSLSPSGETQDRSLYFFTNFSSSLDAMNYFISDFPRAASASSTFDASVRGNASTVSNDYADLVDLSIRQVFGMVEITAAKDSNGNWNLSDVQAFMGGGPGGGRISTVDIMYPAFPMFLQTNPVIAGALLKPLLQWQQDNGYPFPGAAHDLGKQYPIAVGSSQDGDLPMPVEEAVNMLIMTLAQARASGDATLVVNFYGILDEWAQYLISVGVNTGDQNFTDTFLTGSVANDTNLALKSMIGIQAMAGIASAANNTAAADKYSGVASGLLAQWQQLAYSTNHSQLLLNFGNETSSLWLPYNLYADKLLGLNMVPKEVYDQVATLIKSQIREDSTTLVTYLTGLMKGNTLENYGVAMDSRSNTASKTDWALFTAATLSDTGTQNALISSVRSYAANQLATVPFSDFYDVVQGTSLGFQARPVQGAMYSILALQTPAKQIMLPPPQSSTTVPSSPTSTRKNSAQLDRGPSLLAVLTPLIFIIFLRFGAGFR